MATTRIRSTKTHIPVFNGADRLAYSNFDKAELIAHSLISQLTLNQDVVNPRTVDTVRPKVEDFLHTDHGNTLNPATSSKVRLLLILRISKRKTPLSSIAYCISTNILMYLLLNFVFFLIIPIKTMINLREFLDCWKKALIVSFPNWDRKAIPLIAPALSPFFLVSRKSTNIS